MAADMDEMELLRRYAQTKDREAFARLVDMHGGWIYCAARRQLGDEHLAEDVTQAVFLLLSRRAVKLQAYAYLSGWLFRATQWCVKEAKRQRIRREKREREAAKMRDEAVRQSEWEEISPMLDEAVGRLRRKDREVVLLRFYRGMSLGELAVAVGIGEEAAKKRVQRAVERLRGVLEGRGVTAGATGLGAVMAERVMEAPGIFHFRFAISDCHAANVIAKGAGKMMVWAKVKVVAAISAVTVVAVVAGAASTKPTSGPIALTLTLPSGAAPQVVGPESVLILDNCDDRPDGSSDNLTGVDSAGMQVFRVPGFSNCESIGSSRMIATDSTRQSIWVCENVSNRIRRFDLSGNETLSISDVGATAIAVDPETGNLWALEGEGSIGTGKTVVYSSKGQQIASHDISGWDIVYDRKTKAFWIAERGLTKLAAATGEVTCSVDVARWCASSVDVDPTSGAVWVATRAHPEVAGSSNQLLRFDAEGRRLAAIDLGKKTPFRVSVDRNDSSVWVAYFKGAVQRFSIGGVPEAEHAVEALSVQADSRGEVWVVTPGELLKMTRNGEVTMRLRHAGKTSQGWIATVE